MREEDKKSLEKFNSILDEVYKDDPIKIDIKNDFIKLNKKLPSFFIHYSYICNYFNILSNPIIMTQKEYHEQWRELSKEDIVKKLNNKEIKNKLKCAYLTMMLEERNNIFYEVIEKPIINKGLLQKVADMTDEFKFYIEKIEIENILNSGTLESLFTILAHYSQFNSAEYSKIRKKEKETAIKLAKKTLRFADKIDFDIFFHLNLKQKDSELKFDKIINIYKIGLKKIIINAFKKPDGIEKLSQPCKDLLYTKNDYLYPNNNKSELLKLVSELKDITVLDNFYDYLYVLFSKSPKDILEDDNFREVVWEAVMKSGDIVKCCG